MAIILWDKYKKFGMRLNNFNMNFNYNVGLSAEIGYTFMGKMLNLAKNYKKCQ